MVDERDNSHHGSGVTVSRMCQQHERDLGHDLEGRFRSIHLRDGLRLQASNAEYREDVSVAAGKEASLSVHLFFADSDGLEIRYGGRALPIGDHRGEMERPFGFVMSLRQAELYARKARRGARQSYVTVWLSQDWLRQTFGMSDTRLPPGAREHLAISRWFPSQRLTLLAASLLKPDASDGGVSRLGQEIVALEMVKEAVSTLRPTASWEGARSDMLLLNKACALIDLNLSAELPVPRIASEVGIGIGTLRHLFRKAYGCTISDYIRVRRLEAARTILEEGGAVSAAAAFAGYTSPANFSTAFRRHFGITPRQARAGE